MLHGCCSDGRNINPGFQMGQGLYGNRALLNRFEVETNVIIAEPMMYVIKGHNIFSFWMGSTLTR